VGVIGGVRLVITKYLALTVVIGPDNGVIQSTIGDAHVMGRMKISLGFHPLSSMLGFSRYLVEDDGESNRALLAKAPGQGAGNRSTVSTRSVEGIDPKSGKVSLQEYHSKSKKTGTCLYGTMILLDYHKD
jgi:hypothetical protein